MALTTTAIKHALSLVSLEKAGAARTGNLTRTIDKLCDFLVGRTGPERCGRGNISSLADTIRHEPTPIIVCGFNQKDLSTSLHFSIPRGAIQIDRGLVIGTCTHGRGQVGTWPNIYEAGSSTSQQRPSLLDGRQEWVFSLCMYQKASFRVQRHVMNLWRLTMTCTFDSYYWR